MSQTCIRSAVLQQAGRMLTSYVCDREQFSEEVGLLHDAQELLLVHLTVTIAVCFVNHLLKFLVSHPLAELLRDTLQVLERDLASLIIIEQAECLQDLIPH